MRHTTERPPKFRAFLNETFRRHAVAKNARVRDWHFVALGAMTNEMLYIIRSSSSVVM